MTAVRLVVDDGCQPVARALLHAAGRRLVPPPGAVRADEVVEVDATTAAGVRDAIGVVLRGGSVLARASSDTLPGVVTDLGALGPLDAWVAGATDLPVLARLGPDHVALLAVLAGGGSTTEAASVLHLSQRSVERRIKEARTLLGVGSVAEAVVELARLLAAWRAA